MLKIAPDDTKGNTTKKREHRYAYLPPNAPNEFGNPYKCFMEGVRLLGMKRLRI